jgi:hypothetical protein
MSSEIILGYGGHDDDSEEVCLLEACSLPPGVRPRKGLPRTDHPPDVEPVRAQFGRTLNDSYGEGPDADRERTEDCAALVTALRGTAALKDGDRVVRFLLERALRTWWPDSLAGTAQMLRETCGQHAELRDATEKATAAIDAVITKLQEMPVPSLAALADLADRADLADLAARAARADLAALRKKHPPVDVWLTKRREMRKAMAEALLETCRW